MMDAARAEILVVDDDADDAELIRLAFARHEPPYRVTAVDGGAACLAALADRPIALLVLDYRLGGETGLDVLARVRAREFRVPAVIVTGQGSEQVAAEALRAGAADYVVKAAGYRDSLPAVAASVLARHHEALLTAGAHQDACRRLRETEALLALSRALTPTLEYRPLLGAITDAATAACQMERCGLYLWEDGRIVQARGVSAATARLDGRPVNSVPVIADVARRGEPIVIEAPAVDPLRRFGGTPRAMLVLPLACGAEVVGALVLETMEGPARITEDQVRFGAAIAAQVALGVENARRCRDAHQALAERSTADERLVRGETLRALGELAAGTAHHLNNLLAVVVGRTELLLGRDVSAPIRRPLELILRAARDGAEVVRRIQEFARTKHPDAWEAVSLDEVAQDVLEMTRFRWRDGACAEGLTIDAVHHPGGVPPVAGHAASLREVVTNLVLNAIEALPGGGHITMRTWAEGGTVALSVADDGVGMPPDVLRRAQEPFFTTKGVKSTGLGLSVNYGIVKRHNGTTTIESAVGRGTTVTLRLPAHAPLIRAPEPAAPKPAQGLRIMVVDDEDTVRRTLAALVEADGHVAIAVSSGREALARLERDAHADVLITDLGMPEMTGWQLAAAVRRRWPTLPIGLVTGWGTDPAGPSEDGATPDFLLPKPVGREELRRALAGLGLAAPHDSESPGATVQ
jgi:signal transduction histidine kinase/CheY-like chemotaxis protein